MPLIAMRRTALGLRAKSCGPNPVARDMYEKYASFNDYVNEYRLEQSEGAVTLLESGL